jgi:ADP-heptose:LPS heptosyltransferase
MIASTTTRRRLVILRALGLGDFLTAIPAFRALARSFPNHLRILVAPLELAPLARLSGAIDEVADSQPLAPLAPKLEHPDVAVNLHGCGPQSHRILLATQPERMIAFACRGVFNAAHLPAWIAEEHEVERWCRMLEAFGIACDRDDLDLVAKPAAQRDYVVLHPGASSEARRWPVERWVGVARALAECNVPMKITGSASDFRRARAIARAAGLGIGSVIAGKTSLESLASVVGSARAVVCGDTGVAHLATATRTPSVVLFGPMSPRRWGPPVQRRWHRVIWHGASGDPHASSVDHGLAEISVDEVLENLSDVAGLSRR